MKNFEKTYKLITKLKSEINKATNVFDEGYYKAINLLSEISEKSYHNRKLNTMVLNYKESKSTLDLKEILFHVNYDDMDLCDFYAFTIIDSVAAKL